ncbi:MAG: PIN domain-containing protein [Patescibacteria group bacterium]
MSAIQVIDTNVLLRFLVGDNAQQYEQARSWLKEAEQGKRKIKISSVVIAETCYVLESFYKKSRTSIAEVFELFLSQKWLEVEDRDVMLAIWEQYRKKLRFVDSYLLVKAKLRGVDILTFDAALLKVYKELEQ